ERRAQGMQTRIHCQTDARRERNAFGAGTAERRIAEPRERKKDKGLILFHHLLRGGWMRVEPGANGLQRNIFPRKRALRDQDASDGRVGPSVRSREDET